MRRITLSILIVLVATAVSVAQMRQAGKAFSGIRSGRTAALATSELLKGLNNISTIIHTPSVGAVKINGTTAVKAQSPNLPTDLNGLDATSLTRAARASLSVASSANGSSKELESFRQKYLAGELDTKPSLLLAYCSMVDRKGNRDFACRVYEKAKSKYLTVSDVCHFCKYWDGLREKCGDLLRYIVQRNYIYREGGIVPFKADSITEAHKHQLLALAKSYSPDLQPIIKMVYRTDNSDLLDQCRTVTDSIISGASSFESSIQNHVFSVTLDELMAAKEYDCVLKYFAAEPLATYAADNVDVVLTLCEAALGADDNDKFNCYMQKAFDIDRIAARKYYDDHFHHIIEVFVENPTSFELAD